MNLLWFSKLTKSNTELNCSIKWDCVRLTHFTLIPKGSITVKQWKHWPRVYGFIHPFNHPSINLFIHPLIRPFINSIIDSLIHPCIQSFIPALTCRASGTCLAPPPCSAHMWTGPRPLSDRPAWCCVSLLTSVMYFTQYMLFTFLFICLCDHPNCQIVYLRKNNLDGKQPPKRQVWWPSCWFSERHLEETNRSSIVKWHLARVQD